MENSVVIADIDQSMTTALQRHLGSKTTELAELLKEFHNVFLKVIPERPRHVHLSKELLCHSLFQNEKRKVIEEIIDALKNGDSLAPYLSEKSEQLNHFDLSLAHFGVHHFHLGGRIQTSGARSGRVKGTKSLLFVRIVDDVAYLLNILNHDMRRGFLNVSLLRIMHSNWPDSIEPFRLKGANGVAVKYTDEEAAELLENDVNVIIELGEEQVYLMPGMGTTTAGTPLLVERRVDQTLDGFRDITQMVEQNPNAVSALIRQLTGIGHNVIRLSGRIRTGLLDIYDSTSGCVFTTERDSLVVSVPDEF